MYLFVFHHAKGSTIPTVEELRSQMQRLENHKLETLTDELLAFLPGDGCSRVLMSLNAQFKDISEDHVMAQADVLALSET